MIQTRQGLWIQEPAWNDVAKTFLWMLDVEQGSRSGTLDDFEREARALVEQDLADIRQIVGREP